MTRRLDRRSVVRGAAGLAGGALLAACGAEPVRRSDPSPLPLANVEPWGANVFLDVENEDWKRRHSLELLRAAGVRWIFQRIGWDAVETVDRGLFVNPQRRESSWDRFDDIVDRAQEQGISVVARIERSPQWARPGRDNPTAPPADLADFAAFLRTLAERYQDRIQHYQIWHEPNLAANWGGAAPDPAGYAELLRVAYDTLKSADDRLVVAGAQLAPTLENNPRAISDLAYLRQIYDHGAAEALDIQGAAAFGMQYSPSTPADPRVLNFRRVELLRNLMVEYGRGDAPVWLSAYGWNAAPPDLEASQSAWRRVEEPLQAAWTVDGVRFGLREWPWIGVFGIWYFRQSFAALGPDDASYYFRMVDPDFTPRPVYRAVQEAATGHADL